MSQASQARTEAATAVSRALGTWLIALNVWALLRLLALHLYDDFGIAPWFYGLAATVGGMGVASGLAQRAQKRWGRALYCAALFVGLVAMTELENQELPGRFWAHIIAHLVLAWWLWGETVTHALAPERSEAPGKPGAPSHVHLVFAALIVADVLNLVHVLGGEG